MVEGKILISNRLTDFLVSKNISSARFAKDLGVGEGTVSRWVHGRSIPNSYYVFQICTIYDISANWLLGLED